MKTELFDHFLAELLGADMSLNESPKDYGLLDVIASLGKGDRTGRLQITVGSTRGAFFFKDGQLLDARVGTLTGFAAVNLAISGGATVLNFDSSIDPPAPRFTDSNERRLLKTRFGIDTAVAEVQSAQRSGVEGRLKLVTQASVVPPSLEPLAREEVLVRTASVGLQSSATVVPLRIAGSFQKPANAALQETVVPVSAVGTAPQTATASLRNVTAPLNERWAITRLDESAKKSLTSLVSTQSLSLAMTNAKTNLWAVQKKVASVSQSLQALGTQSVSNLRNKKTAVRAASIALIVIPAAVGFTSYWSKGKERVPIAVTPPLAASSGKIPAVAPSTPLVVPPAAVAPPTTSGDEQSIAKKPLINLPADAARVRHDAPPSSKAANPQLSAPSTAPEATKTISSETVADASEKKESAAAEVATQTPEEKQLAKPSSRGITVEVRVEGGRVSEAFIKNRRPGLEGYEAAALRLARQRRYPKETTTTETLVIQVKGEH